MVSNVLAKQVVYNNRPNAGNDGAEKTADPGAKPTSRYRYKIQYQLE